MDQNSGTLVRIKQLFIPPIPVEQKHRFCNLYIFIIYSLNTLYSIVLHMYMYDYIYMYIYGHYISQNAGLGISIPRHTKIVSICTGRQKHRNEHIPNFISPLYPPMV